MREASSDDVRGHFRETLNDVERNGEHVKVIRYRQVAAVMVPEEWYDRAEACLAAQNGAQSARSATD